MAKKMTSEQVKTLMAIADVQLAGTYHSIYERLGAERGSSGPNHMCFEADKHEGGTDNKPSMGIDNDRGVYHCFSCGLKGGLYTYWKNYIKSGNDMYHEFLNSLGVTFVDPDSGLDCTNADVVNMKSLYKKYSGMHEEKTGKKHLLNDTSSSEIVKDISLDMSELDNFVENLLSNEGAMSYIFKTRKIGKDDIVKYRIGLDKKSGAFIFPVLSPDRQLSTMKAYNPRYAPKWRYLYRNRDMYPVPIQNFASDTLFFFEGEPDAFCAIGFGISGALTLGGASNVDPAKMLGNDLTSQYLKGKEVVICFDADKAGRDNAEKLARNVYEYARQIKILDLDMSKVNPNGLDPDNTYMDGTKKKRKEKDFTDFMQKNGFGDTARDTFLELVRNTKAYTDSRSRGVEVYKVTVGESRLPKYHSEYGGVKKRIQLIASVSDIDTNAYLYYDKLPIECPAMSTDPTKFCAHCSLPSMNGFSDGLVHLHLNTEIEKVNENSLNHIRVVEKDILEMIEVSEYARISKLKHLSGINPKCSHVRFREGHPVKLIHAKLMKDISFHSDMADGVHDSDIDVDAYISGVDIQGGKSYLFEGVQTTTPDGQYAAIYVDKVEPVLTSVESFNMTPDLHDELKAFRPRDEETIHDALSRRYKEFSAEARITNRNELFLMYDLAFFSSTGFNNSLISDSVRKWVEVGVVGESRCGKSMVAEFLVNKYKTGEYFSCSSAITRSGILGGISKSMKKSKISWGVTPRNDKGIVVIDEVAHMSPSLLADMTPSRTSGVVNIEMTISGKAYARTRKIFVSNPRSWEAVKGQPYEGFQAIKNVYERDEIIQRFDLMTYIKADDVSFDEFEYHYDVGTSEFTDLQCRHLIMWSHSRGFDDYEWEDGVESFNKYVTSESKTLLDKYHDKTLLVGQETYVRIIRLSVSLAAMLYSTPEDNFGTVYVKKDHVDYIIKFMDTLYSNKNMRLHEYSDQLRASESLGDMRFMENILRYVGADSIIRESNFTDKSLQQVFFDYLQRVRDKALFMVDASNDSRKMTGMPPYDSIHKLIQTMVARNCLIRNKNRFEKTPMFTSWLDKMRRVEDDKLSRLLEYETDPEEIEEFKRAATLVERFEERKRVHKQPV